MSVDGYDLETLGMVYCLIEIGSPKFHHNVIVFTYLLRTVMLGLDFM